MNTWEVVWDFGEFSSMLDLTRVLLTFSLLRPMKSIRFGLFEVNLGYGEGDLNVLGLLCV